MKKQIAIIVCSFIILSLIAILVSSKPNTDRVPATVVPSGSNVVVPQHAVEVAPGVFDLGTTSHNGEEVQGYMFIHYKDGQAHKPAHGGGGGTTCYAFLSSGARWKTTEPYVLDTSNSDGMSSSYVESVVEASLDAWDSQVLFDIFGPRDTLSTVDGVDTSSPDGKNEILFGNIADSGAIAVTTVWGIFSGPPGGRKLVEFDALYDDPDFNWGDATLNASLMDFQNVAAHEHGHAAGMGHPSGTCTEETMYAYATEGETKKRDLNAGDIEGIKKLYK